MQTTGAALVTTLLNRQGITTIAGIPGGANLPLYDALAASPIRHVLARHEQGAGFIAQGMARATGCPAVCFGTSGPGATNLLTAIADAKLDSIPLVAITGQVPRAMIGTDAFQEIDTYGLTVPITKHNYLVRSAAELLEVIPDAFRIAASGRPGPVVIDVPKDVQNETIDVDRLPEPGRPDPPPQMDTAAIAHAADLVSAAARPLFLVGAGVIAADAAPALRRLAERADIPVAATLLGLGALPGRPSALPRHGRHARRALHQPRARGVRPADRGWACASTTAPPASVDEFCPRRPDRPRRHRRERARQDPAADVRPGGRRCGCARCPLVRAAGQLRPTWRTRIDSTPQRPSRCAWPASTIPAARTASCATPPRSSETTRSSPATSASTRCGWRRPTRSRRPRQWLTSGGLGTMGFGLPAAIGAALARPERPVGLLHRRRQPADEHPGARHRSPRRTSTSR